MSWITDICNTVGGHYCWHSRNLSTVLTDSLSRTLVCVNQGSTEAPFSTFSLMFVYGKLWLLLGSCCECGALKKKEQTQKKIMKFFRVKQKSREIRNKVFNHCFVQICVWSFFFVLTIPIYRETLFSLVSISKVPIYGSGVPGLVQFTNHTK